MRLFLRIIGRLGVVVLLAVLVFFLYLQMRGGFYRGYAASDFAHLTATGPSLSTAGDLVAHIDSGALRGTRDGSAIAFKGIPYARPPIAELRWEPPQPAASWPGVKDASQAGGSCMQPSYGLTRFFQPMAQAYGSDFQETVQPSEDCLYLNVWTPEWPVKQALPVMVWLHGGSNISGSGTQSTYDGASVTARGVIVVTINYRLGVFGFFSHPELSGKSPHHASGNYGLMDQLAALAWVQKNISQFGGDPQNVTLFGESAGGIDSAMLMTSPLSAGLFRRVISESGPAFGPAVPLAQAESFGKSVADLAPGDPNQTPLERLRALPAAEVDKLVAQAKEHYTGDTSSFTADGWVLTQSPRKAFLSGQIQKVDLLIGLNGREMSAFRLSAAAQQKAGGNQKPAPAPDILKQTSDAARPYFGAWTNPAIALYLAQILIHHNSGTDHVIDDIVAACPIGAMAEMTNAAGSHVFLYRFDRSVPGKGEDELGAFHSLEVPYVFGALHDPTWHWLPFTSDDEALSNLIQTYWTNFAKTGNPNASGLPPWPQWSRKEEFLEIRKDGKVTAQHTFHPLFSNLSAESLHKSFNNE